MLKKALSGITAFILLSTVALGVVSASPNAQTNTGPMPLEFLVTVLTDANDKGVLPDSISDLLSGWFIENLIAPHTGETVGEVEGRLSVEGQSPLDFLVAVLRDANDKGVLPDSISDLLSGWFIENLIAPHTGETPEQIRERLSAQPTPAMTTTPTIVELVRNVQNGVVWVIAPSGYAGSGFVIDSDERVVTNEHVVEQHSIVTVRLYNGREFRASVLGVDPVADLAIIDIVPNLNLQTVPLGDSALVQKGDEVITMGYPDGYQLGQPPTWTRGNISWRRIIDDVESFKHTAPTKPGNSGGPLFNRTGQVVGVNTSAIRDTTGNVGFAVAINELKARLPALIQGQPAAILSPTPIPSKTGDWRWDRWGPRGGGWRISIPSDWSFEPHNSTSTRAHFGENNGSGFVNVNSVPNLSSRDIYGLDDFAQWRKSTTESWGAENYPTSFKVRSFGKNADRGGREFYELQYEYYYATGGCWAFGMEHIFTDQDYGAVASGEICDSDGVLTAKDWGSIPEILDSFEIHLDGSGIYRNNLYGYSLDWGSDYLLATDEETHDSTSFFGYEGRNFVAYINVTTLEAGKNKAYNLDNLARAQRDYLADYSSEQNWPIFQVKSLTKSSETSPVDGVERQWYEFKYRLQTDAEYCVEDQ